MGESDSPTPHRISFKKEKKLAKENPLPFTSLSAATSTGSGASKDLEGVFRTHTLAVTITGSPSAFSINLQGSHDGISWYTSNAAATLTEQNVGTAGYATHDLYLWRYVRANLTVLTGGSSPTVTATIASA